MRRRARRFARRAPTRQAAGRGAERGAPDHCRCHAWICALEGCRHRAHHSKRVENFGTRTMIEFLSVPAEAYSSDSREVVR